VVAIPSTGKAILIPSLLPYKALYILRDMHMEVVTQMLGISFYKPCLPTWSPISPVTVEVPAKDPLDPLHQFSTFIAASAPFPKVWACTGVAKVCGK